MTSLSVLGRSKEGVYNWDDLQLGIRYCLSVDEFHSDTWKNNHLPFVQMLLKIGSFKVLHWFDERNRCYVISVVRYPVDNLFEVNKLFSIDTIVINQLT